MVPQSREILQTLVGWGAHTNVSKLPPLWQQSHIFARLRRITFKLSIIIILTYFKVFFPMVTKDFP